jgi:integrase
VTPEQLLAASSVGNVPVPTIREYLAHVADVVPAGTRRVYDTYWRRVVMVWGDRRIDEPTPTEIKGLSEQIKPTVVPRRNSRGGRTAAEHLIGALRCMYRHAVADGLISEHSNPAIRVAKPRRLPSTRRAIPAARLAEINAVAASTGNDPDLDSLLLRLHIETACRRGGALALCAADLDHEQCLICLREKGGTIRWQPVSPTLMSHLTAHHVERGHQVMEQLLRYRNGHPITARRYDYLWTRIGNHLRWVAVQQISTHWLRHTTLTWVERNFGYAVARAYAGHNGKSGTGSTSTYIRADLQEVATALSVLTNESHPLASGHTGRS